MFIVITVGILIAVAVLYAFSGAGTARVQQELFHGNYYAEDAVTDENDVPNSKESIEKCIENGMGINVGRIREDKVYDFKFVGLSHNTVRGAAGGAVLCAELLKAQGYITKK